MFFFLFAFYYYFSSIIYCENVELQSSLNCFNAYYISSMYALFTILFFKYSLTFVIILLEVPCKLVLDIGSSSLVSMMVTVLIL